MVVTALGLLLGGRADSGAVRSGARQARVEGVVAAGATRRAPGTPSPPRSTRPAARSRTTGSCWPATCPPRVAPARSWAARRCRSPPWRRSPSRWSPSTASPTSTGCCSPGPSATRSTGSAGQGARPRRPPTATLYTPAAAPSRPSSPRSSRTARERAREADLLRFGLGEIEAVAPEPGEDSALAAEESRLGFADTLRAAAEQAREALSSEESAPDALAAVAAARAQLEAVREHDPEAGELADRLAEVTYLLSDVAADVASYATRIDTDPARLGGGLRAAGRADRADPQVRREHRRGAGLGRAVVHPAARPRLHRRAHRAAPRRAGDAARRAGRGRRSPHRRPHRGRRPAVRPGHRRSSHCSRCPTRASTSR